jgi:hypothetical protein
LPVSGSHIPDPKSTTRYIVRWASAGPAFGRPSGLLSGAVGVGSALAAFVGVLILPFILLGLLAGIGALGIIPFLVARTSIER